MCEQNLKNLKNFLASENLAEKYDEIFKENGQNKIIEKVPFNEVPIGQVHHWSSSLPPTLTSTKRR